MGKGEGRRGDHQGAGAAAPGHGRRGLHGASTGTAPCEARRDPRRGPRHGRGGSQHTARRPPGRGAAAPGHRRGAAAPRARCSVLLRPDAEASDGGDPRHARPRRATTCGRGAPGAAALLARSCAAWHGGPRRSGSACLGSSFAGGPARPRGVMARPSMCGVPTRCALPYAAGPTGACPGGGPTRSHAGRGSAPSLAVAVPRLLAVAFWVAGG